MDSGYSSPEQVQGRAVTTRSDVYSLGLILYEMLCGEKGQTADTTSPALLETSICEVEPVPLSQRVAARGDRALSRQLAGDLETTLPRPLPEEPSRRYGSVAELDRDLARYLEGRPVSARPATAAYRARKFIRRHRLALLSTCIVLLSIVAGLLSTVHQARRAERRFNQVRALAHAFVFDVHDRSPVCQVRQKREKLLSRRHSCIWRICARTRRETTVYCANLSRLHSHRRRAGESAGEQSGGSQRRRSKLQEGGTTAGFVGQAGPEIRVSGRLGGFQTRCAGKSARRFQRGACPIPHDLQRGRIAFANGSVR